METDEDYISGDDEAIPKHISVVTDFYRRFAKQITAMMENNKEANAVSVMGRKGHIYRNIKLDN